MKKSLGLVCGALAMLFASHVFAEVSISSPWVRLLPPGVKTTAAYMLINTSEADQLLGGKSPAVDRVELHESSMQDGMMQMRHIPELNLEAGAQVELKPGSYHLMLIGLKQSLAEGQTVPVTLIFEQAGEVMVDAVVRQP